MFFDFVFVFLFLTGEEGRKDVATRKVDDNFLVSLYKLNFSLGKPWTFPGVQDYASQRAVPKSLSSAHYWELVRNADYQDLSRMYQIWKPWAWFLYIVKPKNRQLRTVIYSFPSLLWSNKKWETQKKPNHRSLTFSQGSLWYLSCVNCFLIVSTRLGMFSLLYKSVFVELFSCQNSKKIFCWLKSLFS